MCFNLRELFQEESEKFIPAHIPALSLTSSSCAINPMVSWISLLLGQQASLSLAGKGRHGLLLAGAIPG